MFEAFLIRFAVVWRVQPLRKAFSSIKPLESIAPTALPLFIERKNTRFYAFFWFKRCLKLQKTVFLCSQFAPRFINSVLGYGQFLVNV